MVAEACVAALVLWQPLEGLVVATAQAKTPHGCCKVAAVLQVGRNTVTKHSQNMLLQIIAWDGLGLPCLMQSLCHK